MTNEMIHEIIYWVGNSFCWTMIGLWIGMDIGERQTEKRYEKYDRGV